MSIEGKYFWKDSRDKYVDLDQASGGYPYFNDDRPHYFNTEADALKYYGTGVDNQWAPWTLHQVKSVTTEEVPVTQTWSVTFKLGDEFLGRLTMQGDSEDDVYDQIADSINWSATPR